jgi:hypothetical protein
VDYRKYHDKDRELAFYKFLTLLLRKRVMPGKKYIVYLDRRTDRQPNRLLDLKRILNTMARKEHSLRYDCCRDVQALDSKKEVLLQAADVILGAVGWHYARSHEDPTSCSAKNILADRVAKGIGRAHLAFTSGPNERKFNVWRWDPNLRGGQK